MRKLWKDRRGNAIMIAGAALPLVVGAAGLATDTIQWTVWKRQLQRTADSAALAGVYAEAQSATVNSAVNEDINNNNKTKISLLTGYPQITYPTSTYWTNGVQVTLAIQKKLGFSSMFITTPPIITASATAAMVDQGPFCAGAAKKTGSALTIGGSSNVSLGCNAISNSHSNPAVATNGNAYNFSAPIVAGVGTLPDSIIGVTTLQPHHLAQPDPYAGKYSTDIPSGMSCTNFNSHRTNLGTGASPNYHLSPGCYSGFSPNGSNTYTMDPGVYYLDSTDFALNGSDTLIGTGVTIILTGTTPGSVKTNGTSTIQLSAPTSSNCGSYGSPAVNTCSYKNMLFIQSSSAAAENNNTINGTAGSSYDGAMYFPMGAINFTGNSGNITKCAAVWGYTLTFSGNTNLQNNTTGCTAATTWTGKGVRLVG